MEHSVTLSGYDIVLRPLQEQDAPAFRALVDRKSWTGMSVPLPENDDDMKVHLNTLIDADSVIAFAIEQQGKLVGRTALYDLVSGLRTEIGNTFCAPQIRGTYVNKAVKLLLFSYCFERLGPNRVALRCDSRNQHSHQAIASLGATYQGRLRGFRFAADGSIVDVDYFSVLASEWPQIKENLTAKVQNKLS